MPTDFNLPELGEQIESGDVLRVLVKPGDTLAKDQPVLELETDKATIEVPSSVAGQVKEIKVKAGDKVKVGQTILTVEEPGQNADAKTAGTPDDAAGKPDRQAEPDRAPARPNQKTARTTETIAPPGTDAPAASAESASQAGVRSGDDDVPEEAPSSRPPRESARRPVLAPDPGASRTPRSTAAAEESEAGMTPRRITAREKRCVRSREGRRHHPRQPSRCRLAGRARGSARSGGTIRTPDGA